MSGGFFRGTSADQDTRFSNKQAKLLKSQKFAPELEQLVDITKVKMDVIRPWIATRVTELLGFEDEVLINFIYGLLEGRVDGKQIQIQLTGFMEKNTGKFMKELWNLLISAQKNASGVPQQFLDAKEEEMKKKKVETDRLTQEIQKRKEKGGWGPEPDRKTRMDAKAETEEARDAFKTLNSHADSSIKQSVEDVLDTSRKGSVDGDSMRSSRRKTRQSPSPRSPAGSPSSLRRTSLANRSRSRSPSNSRSYSGRNSRSRSTSASPSPRRHSFSHEKKYISPRRQPISPRRPRSPLRRPSPYSRRRSLSHSRHRSPSPTHRRSPIRRRSRSPLRHRSRSPIRYRSPSPRRHLSRSPSRRRSPIYIRRRTPSLLRHRSPVRRRSPLRRASPSPPRRVSPLPRSPKGKRRSPLPSPRRSYSPLNSPSPVRQSYRSPVKNTTDPDNRKKPQRYQDGHRSPARHLSEREVAERTASGREREDFLQHKKPSATRSPHRDVRDRQDTCSAVVVNSVLVENNAFLMDGREKQSRQKREDISKEMDNSQKSRFPPEDGESKKFTQLSDGGISPNGERKIRRGYERNRANSKASPSPGWVLPTEEIEYGPGRVGDGNRSAGFSHEDWVSGRGGPSPSSQRKMHDRSRVENSPLSKDIRSANANESTGYRGKRGKPNKIERKKLDVVDTDSEDGRRDRKYPSERKMIKYGNDASTDETGYDSQMDDYRDRKRKRKDEKKLRKEEKRRRREERHRRKEERRGSKQKTKHSDPGVPTDSEDNQLATDHSDDARMHLKLADNEEIVSEQKKLEIELREKALETLRAKKAIAN